MIAPYIDRIESLANVCRDFVATRSRAAPGRWSTAALACAWCRSWRRPTNRFAGRARRSRSAAADAPRRMRCRTLPQSAARLGGAADELLTHAPSGFAQQTPELVERHRSARGRRADLPRLLAGRCRTGARGEARRPAPGLPLRGAPRRDPGVDGAGRGARRRRVRSGCRAATGLPRADRELSGSRHANGAARSRHCSATPSRPTATCAARKWSPTTNSRTR